MKSRLAAAGLLGLSLVFTVACGSPPQAVEVQQSPQQDSDSPFSSNRAMPPDSMDQVSGAEMPEQVPAPSPTPSLTAPVPQPKPTTAAPAAAQNSLSATDEFHQRVYRFRMTAEGCKPAGFANPRLSTTLAAQAFSSLSERLYGELLRNNSSMLEGYGFLSGAIENAATATAFLEKERILPIAEATTNELLGAAFINTGKRKTLVLYGHPVENAEKKLKGFAFNISSEGFNEQLWKRGGLSTAPGIYLVYNDVFSSRDPQWKLHHFAPGETAAFEVLKGVAESRLSPPRNPCASKGP